MAGSPVFRWLLFAMFALAVWPLRALEIQQTLWGFDGHVVAEDFNPLSVLVSNSSDTPFGSALILSRDAGGGTPRGADLVQSISLAPHASRWVQFYVHISSHVVGNRLLRWGRGAKENYEVKEPEVGAPGCIWMRAADSPVAAGVTIKSFPDSLFPVTAVAAEGLDAVVLEHVPRWEPARREAFLDWVRLGGTVHLLPGADGQFPVFGEGLEVLNTKDNETRIGSGQVVHHQIALPEMNEAYLTAHGFPARTVMTPKDPAVYEFQSGLFHSLSSLTRPQVNWSLIYLLVFTYVVVIGPLHSFFRRRLDYRASIATFLGCVGVFALGLGTIGRRGYGESQTAHSLAIAHSLGGGRADVTQWISAFATTGDRYTLSHRAPANLYATDEWLEAGSGSIFNGQDGHMVIDIPLYSSRAFIHEAIMAADDTSVTVDQWDNDDSTLSKLRLRPAAGFPLHPREIHAAYGGHFYELTLRDGVLQRTGAPPQSLASYFSRERLNPPIYINNPGHEDPEIARKFIPLLEARALHFPSVFPTDISPPARPADLQLFIIARTPASLQLQGQGFTHENGWVLYVQDVFRP